MKPTNKKRKASSGGAAPAKKPKTNARAKGGKPAAAAKPAAGKPDAKRGKKPTAAPPKKRGSTPQLPENTDDVDVDEDDVAFFEENAQFSSFLVKMDSNRLSKGMFTKEKKPKAPAKPVEAAAEQGDEPLEKLEARPRRPGWENPNQLDLTSKLPVKFMDGSVRQNKLLAETAADASKAKKAEEAAAEAQREEEEEELEEEEEEEEELDSDVSDMEFEELQTGEEEEQQQQTMETAVPVSAVDLELQRRRRLAEKKIEIAQLCEKILESPEDALKKNKEHPQSFSKVQELHALTSDADLTVQKLALLSELSVFLDILPDYRIRLQAPDESGKTKVNGRPLKKKVQQLQDVEAAMLHGYQLFLKTCASLVQHGLKLHGGRSASSPSALRALSLGETAATCLAELLTHKYAFNFHLNLVVALVPLADCQVPSIRAAACAAFEAVYTSDQTFTASLDIVKQIAEYVKQKHHNVQPFVVQTFLKMPLNVTMEQGESSRKKAKADRKKRRKEGDAIAAGLKEAEAVVDRREREKTQGDILHELVLVYFRLLKQATYSPALPAVLEGLAKFAFLINLEIMVDLLKVLKAVLKQNVLPLPAALQAVLTGLRTLQGPGQELMVDEKEFVDILYTLLRQVGSSSDQCVAVALQCVEQVFLKRKELVVGRIAAFIKRLLLLSTMVAPHEALAVLSLVRSLVHRYSKLHQLLESDVDRVAAGEYRADVDDADFCNPYAAAAWELALLARHYHPALAAYALGTAQLAPSLPSETPRAMLEAYSTTGFVPKVPVPPRHPLLAKLAQQQKRKQTQRRQRERKFYVGEPVHAPSPFFRHCVQLDAAEIEGEELLFLR